MTGPTRFCTPAAPRPLEVTVTITVKPVTVGNAPCLVRQGRSYRAAVQPQRETTET